MNAQFLNDIPAIANIGTSEGAAKGWATRREGMSQPKAADRRKLEGHIKEIGKELKMKKGLFDHESMSVRRAEPGEETHFVRVNTDDANKAKLVANSFRSKGYSVKHSRGLLGGH